MQGRRKRFTNATAWIDLTEAALHSSVALLGAWVMRRDVIGALLFAFMLSGFMPSPSASQALDNRAAAAPQQAQHVQADCEDLAALPGQGREYNLFKNIAAAMRGCAGPPPVTYQKSDGHPPPAQQDGHPAPSQQEDLDRAACRSEAERAADAAHGLRPGEYDIFKSTMSARSGDVEKIEQSCMTQRGYKSVVN